MANARTAYQAQIRARMTDYYKILEGATIEKVELKADEFDPEFTDDWPTLTVKLRDGTKVKVEVSQDEEGNGPGFLFGLPTPASWGPVDAEETP